MAKASIDTLNVLHGLIAQYYIDAIESGEELSSGTLAAINTMLKNNDITVDVIENTLSGSTHMKLLSLVEKEA